jgi:uncharacterized protein YggT (Ycf19 family)
MTAAATTTTTRSIVVRSTRILIYFIYFWVIASLVILTLGFFLKLFAANPEAGFVEWVYRNLDRTMEPFRGMFPEQAVGDQGSILDVSILFAMLMYGFVAIAFRALINWLTLKMQRIDRELAALDAPQQAAAGPGTPERPGPVEGLSDTDRGAGAPW